MRNNVEILQLLLYYNSFIHTTIKINLLPLKETIFKFNLFISTQNSSNDKDEYALILLKCNKTTELFNQFDGQHTCRKGSTYNSSKDLILPTSFGILPLMLFHIKFLQNTKKNMYQRKQVTKSYKGVKNSNQRNPLLKRKWYLAMLN